MNKTSRLSVLAVLSVLSLGASAPLAFAAPMTVNVVSNPTNAALYNAVVKAADYLLS